jgi:hypothetical protein
MSAKKKRQDSLKAKEKKQKIIAGVGGVLLLGLLAFQVPRVMKQMNRGGAAAAVPQTVSTPTTTPSLEAPTTLGGQGTGTSGSGSSSSGSGSGSSGLITSSSGGATEGQLASFSRFESKDPFSQQVESASSSSSSGSGSTSGAGSTSAGGGLTGSGSTGSGSTSGGGTSPSPTTAVISVNGTLMSVTVGSDFPAASTAEPNATPLFHLVSLTPTTAKISIAGGSYTSGASAVTLRVNKPVTLMNTADGSRYKLILKPQGTPLPGQSSSGGDTGGSSTTPTVTLPAPSP